MSLKLLLLVLVGMLCPAVAAGAAGPPAPKPAPLGPPTKQQIEAARKAGKVQVRLDTSKGAILLELDGAAAPVSVSNFVNLVKAGFYDSMPFHRAEPNRVVQAGDPALVGKPPVGYTIPDEKSPLKHDRKGLIAMARLSRGGQMVPNSASTQFYITLAPAPHLDSFGFAVFGRVIKGLDVVEKIKRDDKITKATLVTKPERK